MLISEERSDEKVWQKCLERKLTIAKKQLHRQCLWKKKLLAATKAREDPAVKDSHARAVSRPGGGCCADVVSPH